MNKEEAQKYLQLLGEELQKRQRMGEILVNDGVIVMLDIGKPEEQVDIDAYIAYLKGEEPAVERQTGVDAYFKGNGALMREVAASVARHEDLSGKWLDDALQVLFFSSSPEKWLEYAGLRAYVAPLAYMLTMKIAVASSQHDAGDAALLVQKLGITNAQELLTIITTYLPERLLTANMQTMIEQTFI